MVRNLLASVLMGASLAAKDRRIVEARLRLTGAPGRPLGFLTLPTLGAVGWADLRQPDVIPEPILVRPDIRDRSESAWHEAEATLVLYPHPEEEIAGLGPIVPTDASVGWIGITVNGTRDA